MLNKIPYTYFVSSSLSVVFSILCYSKSSESNDHRNRHSGEEHERTIPVHNTSQILMYNPSLNLQFRPVRIHTI